MSQVEERVRNLFGISIETKITAADNLSAPIAKAAQRLIDCLLSDKKIIACGNAGSTANIMHFTSALLNHFDVERPSLPIINLCADPTVITSFAMDGQYDHFFARQIQALGQEGDILLLLTTSGNTLSILHALHAADERNMDTIAISGRDGGLLASHLGPEDIEIRIQADNHARIREIQLFILHCFCDLIDQALFGQTLG